MRCSTTGTRFWLVCLLIAVIAVVPCTGTGTVNAQQLRIDSGAKGSDIGYALAFQADTKPIIAGPYTMPDGSHGVMVTRLTADYKSTDPTFGQNGIVRITGYPVDPLSGVGVAVGGNNQIFVATTIQGAGGGDLAVFAMKQQNGAIDSTFAAGGVKRIDFQNSYERLYKMILTIDGLWMVGFSDKGHPGRYTRAMARMQTNGNVDRTLVWDQGELFSSWYGITTDQDLNVILAGGITQHGTSDTIGCRVKRTGVTDSTYGNQQGMFIVDGSGEGGDDYATAVAVLSNRLIAYIGCATRRQTAQDYAVMVSNQQGLTESGFTFDLGKGGFDQPLCVSPETTTSLIVGGYSVDPRTGWADLSFARLQWQGLGLIPSFGGNGTGWINYSSISDGRIARALSVRPDGRILVIGQAMSPASNFDFLSTVLSANGVETR